VNSIEGAYDDFGARMYDARLGKWMSVDPHDKKYTYMSPYSFCMNNPILFKDLDGRDIYFFDAENKLVTKILLPGEDLAFKLNNYAFKEINHVQIIDAAKYYGKNAYNMTPSAVGINVTGTIAGSGGVHAGLEMVLFLKGPNAYTMRSYWFYGTDIGVELGVAPQFFVAFNNDIDKNKTWQSWTGWFSSINVSTPYIGASYFWGSDQDAPQIFPYSFVSKKVHQTWYGVGVSPPSPKAGVSWNSSYYQSPDWMQYGNPYKMVMDLYDIKQVDLNDIMKQIGVKKASEIPTTKAPSTSSDKKTQSKHGHMNVRHL
jgi:hypothetical protein